MQFQIKKKHIDKLNGNKRKIPKTKALQNAKTNHVKICRT